MAAPSWPGQPGNQRGSPHLAAGALGAGRPEPVLLGGLLEHALTATTVPAERMVRVLGALVGLAEAAGAPPAALLGPVRSAVAVLEADYHHVSQLIEAGDEEELAEAAGMAREHVADMRALLEAHPGLLEAVEREAGSEGEAERALAALERLDALAGEVAALGAGAAVTGATRIDQQDLEELVAATPLEELAELIPAEGGALPAIPPTDPATLFTILERVLGRLGRGTPPLPEPAVPVPEPPTDPVPDLVRVSADALRWLADHGPASLTDWAVEGGWAEATARMAAVTEAWARFGPAGDGSLQGVRLEPLPMVDFVGRGGVGFATRTVVYREEKGKEGEAGGDQPG